MASSLLAQIAAGGIPQRSIATESLNRTLAINANDRANRADVRAEKRLGINELLAQNTLLGSLREAQSQEQALQAFALMAGEASSRLSTSDHPEAARARRLLAVENPNVRSAGLKLAESIFDESNTELLTGQAAVDAGFRRGSTVQRTGRNFKVVQGPAGEGGTTINVGAGEKAEAKGLGEARARQFEAVTEAADSAANRNQKLKFLATVNATTDTGGLTGAKAKVVRTMRGLGLKVGDLSKLTDVESFVALQNQLLAEELVKQKGPQTEGDAQRILATLPNIENTNDANKFIIRANVAFNQRAIQAANFFEDWKDANGTLEGAGRAWRAQVQNTPVFGINPTSGRRVFLNEFIPVYQRANPGSTREDALTIWRQKYAGIQ